MISLRVCTPQTFRFLPGRERVEFVVTVVGVGERAVDE